MIHEFEHGYALIIGVGNTRHTPWSLPVTVKDAKALADTLTAPDRCAYPNDAQHLRFLHDSTATKEHILSGIEWLSDRVATDPNATAIIFYSGHGWLDENTGFYYLISHDTDPNSISESALSAQAFTDALQTVKSARLLVFIDSCHAEGMATTKDATSAPSQPPGFIKAAMPERVADRLALGEGRAVITSSRGQQSSWILPDQSLSIFTCHLIEALQGAGNRLGDGAVYVSNLMQHVARAVPRSAQLFWQAEQVPFFDTKSEDFAVALLLGGASILPYQESSFTTSLERSAALSREEHQKVLREYSAWQVDRYAYVPIAGIPLPLDVDVPLDRVYIRLRALPQRIKKAQGSLISRSMALEELLSFVRRFGELQWQHYQEGDISDGFVSSAGEEPIPPEQAIELHRKLVIIGAPGSGKSTLLRHTVWAQHNLSRAPVTLLIPLGSVDAIMEQKGLSFLDAALDLLTEHKVGDAQRLLRNALSLAIQRKIVLFLCDGLDEVHANKQEIAASLEALATDGHWIVVTSRPLGYQRLEGFDHFEVLPLLPEDATTFATRWFVCLAQARGLADADQRDWAIGRTAWLNAQLADRPGLRELARIPLLLTFLAILAGDDSRDELPRHRKQLYNEYVERLFTTWEMRRRAAPAHILSGAEGREVALWGLYQVAFLLHSTYYGAQLKEQPTPSMVTTYLSTKLEGLQIPHLHAKALAAEVLSFWEQAGLLVKSRIRQEDLLTFRHMTFQEYGAARTLAELDINAVWSILKDHLFVSQWAEVISLTAAHLTSDTATFLFEQLISADANDSELHRPLLLAASALAEGARPSEPLRRKVVDTLIGISRRSRPWSAGNISASAVFAALGKQEDDDKTASALLALAQDKSLDIPVRVLAAEAVGRTGRTDKACALFDEIFRANLSDVTLGLWVIRLTAQMGNKNQATSMLDTVINFRSQGGLQERGIVAGMIAEVFAELGDRDRAVKELSELARNPQLTVEIRLEALRALKRLHMSNVAATLGLELASTNALDSLSTLELVRILKSVGVTDGVRPLLTPLLDDAETTQRERLEAIEEIAFIEQNWKYASLALNVAQHDGIENHIRKYAITVLGAFAQVPQIGPTLLALARDKHLAFTLRREAYRCYERQYGALKDETLTRQFQRETAESANDAGVMTLSEHIREMLRRTSIVVAVAILAGFLVTLTYKPIAIPILAFLYNQQSDHSFSLALLASSLPTITDLVFLVTWPVWVLQIWLFVSPALTRRERRVAGWRVLATMLISPAWLLLIYAVSRIPIDAAALNLPPIQPGIVALMTRIILAVTWEVMVVASIAFQRNRPMPTMGGNVRLVLINALVIILTVPLLTIPPIWFWAAIIGLLVIATLALSLFILAGTPPTHPKLRRFQRAIETVVLHFYLARLERSKPLALHISSVHMSFSDRSDEETLKLLRARLDLPSEASWSLTGIAQLRSIANKQSESQFGSGRMGPSQLLDSILATSDPLEIYTAIVAARDAATSSRYNPATQVRAAAALGSWVHRGGLADTVETQMASTLADICLSSSASYAVRAQCVEILAGWGQSELVATTLLALASEQQYPLQLRIWAVEMMDDVVVNAWRWFKSSVESQVLAKQSLLAIVLGAPRSNYREIICAKVSELLYDANLDARVRRVAQRVFHRLSNQSKRQKFTPRVSFSGVGLIHLFCIVLALTLYQRVILQAGETIFDNPHSIVPHLTPGFSDQLKVSITLSLVILMPLYVLAGYQGANRFLLPHTRRWLRRMALTGLVCLYLTSGLLILALSASFNGMLPGLRMNSGVVEIPTILLAPPSFILTCAAFVFVLKGYDALSDFSTTLRLVGRTGAPAATAVFFTTLFFDPLEFISMMIYDRITRAPQWLFWLGLIGLPLLRSLRFVYPIALGVAILLVPFWITAIAMTIGILITIVREISLGRTSDSVAWWAENTLT